MNRHLLILLCFFTCFYSRAQLTEKNIGEVRTELLQLINLLRLEKGVQPLLPDPKLRQAAILHTHYMVKTQTLSHEEKSATVKTPEKRVRKAKGKEFELVGENILVTVPQTFPLKGKAVKELALVLFEQWKHSPPHYTNMINSEYTLADFGIEADPKTNQVYATTVFGRKGIEIPGQLSRNAFGIAPGSTNCDHLLGNHDNIIANLGNSVVLEGNQVFLYYHNIQLIRKIVDQPTDGFAIDIVFKDQLACGKPNELDFSPVFDGVLLKPVYRDELFASNIAESEYHLIAAIGTIPDAYIGQEFSLSLIVIQGGMECSYTIPIEVPSATYPLTNVEPVFLSESEVKLRLVGVDHSIEIPFDFERNAVSSEPTEMPEAGLGRIHSVDIISYSSVEGRTEDNEQLHTQRARSMLQSMHKHYAFTDADARITTMENWPKMRFQLNYFGMDSLARQSNDSIKAFLRVNKSAFWDSLLFAQRHSSAIIHFKGYPNQIYPSEELPQLNLRTAIIERNDLLANKALYEIAQSEEPRIYPLMETKIFQALQTNPQLVQNAAAVLSLDSTDFLYESTEFLDAWINRMDQLSPDAQQNLLNLYTHVAVRLLDQWDVPSQHLSKVIHPSKLVKAANQLNNHALLLNFHLAAIRYFGQVNDPKHIKQSFEFIAAHFRKADLTATELIDLALFFNDWSRYGLTNELLLQRMEQADFPEDAAFILASTVSLFPKGLTEAQQERVMERAYELNPERWCQLINDNFQLRRNAFVKNKVCSQCDQ